MPELPEVETVVRGLKKSLPGRRFTEVRVGKADFIDDPAALERLLPGSEIEAVERFGKFIDVELTHGSDRGASPLDLIVHLGMTGQLKVQPQGTPAAAHTHVYFALDNGCELRYTDIRRFGRIAVVPRSRRETILGSLGIDPLQITEDQFVELFGSRRARVKALLMDQTVLRGMGNIYTDESLWRAKIHPARIAANLDRERLRRLYHCIQEVLEEAIAARGSSISDYVDSEGARGEFQLRHRVYDRKGERCFRCGMKIRRIIVAGRSSYFCPHCQFAPRKKSARVKQNGPQFSHGKTRKAPRRKKPIRNVGGR
jgi:formamidopyrimidine-DNA glycosylase